jgi:hypothetical protein
VPFDLRHFGLDHLQIDIRPEQRALPPSAVSNGPFCPHCGEAAKVEAGDDQSGLTMIFGGQILKAMPTFNQQPDVSLFVVGVSSRILQLKPVPPNTFDGTTDAARSPQTIIKPAGLTLENNGVDVKLRSPYFPGATWDQIRSLCRAADCFFAHDLGQERLRDLAPDDHRQGEPVVISPTTGMIGYPRIHLASIKVRTLFNPSLVVGPRFKVESQLKGVARCLRMLRKMRIRR